MRLNSDIDLGDGLARAPWSGLRLKRVPVDHALQRGFTHLWHPVDLAYDGETPVQLEKFAFVRRSFLQESEGGRGGRWSQPAGAPLLRARRSSATK